MAAMTTASPVPTERPSTIELPGGPLAYVLRRSRRARNVRLTIDPRRGVVVTVPLSRSRHNGLDATVTNFLQSREAWIRRHLGRQERERRAVAARGGLVDGGTFRFRGELHRLRVEAGTPTLRRSAVRREGTVAADELAIVLATRDRRSVERILRDWLLERAVEATAREVARHAPALGVAPRAVTIRDPRSRWGSAAPTGRLMLSWRLVLAPPEALETVVVHELAHLRVAGHGADFWTLVASRRPDHRAWRRWLREHSFELHAALETIAG